MAGLSVAQLKRAVGFYANRLGISQYLQSKITIFLHIENKEFGYQGMCWWFDDPVRPKEYKIQVLKNNKKEMFSTLAHEMVHVKQYVTGQLRDLVSQKDLVVWEGVRKTAIISGEGYESQPWEAEAYGLEEKLARAFIRSEKKANRW